MKYLKNFLIGAALVVAVITTASKAEAGLQTDAILVGGTNNVLGAATNSYHTVSTSFALVSAKEVAFQLTFANSTAVAATTAFTLDTSVDNVNWMTNAFVFTGTNYVGGTNVCIVVPTNVNGIPFARVGEIRNTNASIYMTNVALKAFVKTGL